MKYPKSFLALIAVFLIQSSLVATFAQSLVKVSVPGNGGSLKFITNPEFDVMPQGEGDVSYTATEFYGNNELAASVLVLNPEAPIDEVFIEEMIHELYRIYNESFGLTTASRIEIIQGKAEDKYKFRAEWFATDMNLYNYMFRIYCRENIFAVLLAIDAGDLPNDIRQTFLNSYEFPQK